MDLQSFYQVIPNHWNPQMRRTLFDGYLFKIVPSNTKLFTKYLRRHPSKHIRTKNYLKSFPDASKSHKTSTITFPIELTSGSFLIGRRGILVIPWDRLVSPGQTYKHCLTNISTFSCQACLSVWPP